MADINIKSSTIEKGLELAKEFLGKLISPTIEETGLLISDNIKYLRFKNQVNILLKAKAYLEKRNIPVKEISLKILVPLLEHSSLEDNETLQDKWAKMLANMVSSETNLQNHIFPYILSQLSIEEFEQLKKLEEMEQEYTLKFREYEKYMNSTDPLVRPTPMAILQLRQTVNSISQAGFKLNISGVSISNLQRLGLIKQLPPSILIEEFRTSSDMQQGGSEQWHQLEAEYEPEDYGFRITALGENFLQICEIKNLEEAHC